QQPRPVDEFDAAIRPRRHGKETRRRVELREDRLVPAARRVEVEEDLAFGRPVIGAPESDRDAPFGYVVIHVPVSPSPAATPSVRYASVPVTGRRSALLRSEGGAIPTPRACEPGGPRGGQVLRGPATHGGWAGRPFGGRG